MMVKAAIARPAPARRAREGRMRIAIQPWRSRANAARAAANVAESSRSPCAAETNPASYADGADRHAAADHLAERGEIGTDAEDALRALRSHAKARHHLVEDEHRAVARAAIAQHAMEFRRGAHEIHVAGDRLEHHCGDLVAEAREGILDLLRVVVIEDQRVRRELRGHAGRGRIAEGERARARLHQ